MAQTQTGIGIKTYTPPDNQLTAAEFNTVNVTVNNNSTDAETRLTQIENDEVSINSRITTLQGTSSKILPYITSNLPISAPNGTLALDITICELVYYKNGGWYKVSDDSLVISISPTTTLAPTTVVPTTVVPTTVTPTTVIPTTTNPPLGFETTWDTSLGDATSQVRLPIPSDNTTINADVYWGDGSFNNVSAWNDSDIDHTYTSGGIYTIQASGVVDEVSFVENVGGDANDQDKDKLLTINNWDTAKVSKESFRDCTNLTTVDATDYPIFTASDDAQGLFRGCGSLSYINTDNWDFSNIQFSRDMFYECNSLLDIDVSNWNTSGFTDIRNMFYYSSVSAVHGIENWDTSNIQHWTSLFFGAEDLVSLDTSNWDTSSATSLDSLFRICGKLESIDTSNWDTSNVTSIQNAFRACTALSAIDVGNWDTSKFTSLHFAFQNCANLETLNTSGWVTSGITTLRSWVFGCEKIDNIDVSNWDTSNVTTMLNAFDSCFVLSGLDVSNWDTAKVTDMRSLFRYCYNLVDLDISNWNVSGVTDMSNMLEGVRLDTSIYSQTLTNWANQNVTSGITFDAQRCQYDSSAVSARNFLINNKGWTINDAGQVISGTLDRLFTTTATSADTIAVDLVMVNDNDELADWIWGDGNQTLNTNSTTHTYTDNLSSHDVEISGINYWPVYQLYVDDNKINYLDVRFFPLLNRLEADNNSLSAIDLSYNTQIDAVWLQNNSLSSVDVSNISNLRSLLVHDNFLSNVNTSSNDRLSILYCHNNSGLSGLNLSNNINLTQINSDNCSLSGIDLSNNSLLTTVRLSDNNLPAIDIDNVIKDLDTFGNQNGTLEYDGNPGENSLSALTEYNSLLSKGWTIIGDTPT